MQDCLTLADAQAHPDATAVVGDIEAWARAYLDTLLHVDDWYWRMAMQHKLFVEYRNWGASAVGASLS